VTGKLRPGINSISFFNVIWGSLASSCAAEWEMTGAVAGVVEEEEAIGTWRSREQLLPELLLPVTAEAASGIAVEEVRMEEATAVVA